MSLSWLTKVIRARQNRARYKNMSMKDDLVAEWKRYLESDEFLHSPECGTLLIARHFAEWGRRHNEQKEDKEND